jgi:uncharacterized cupredoxin-like copper-binding protein
MRIAKLVPGVVVAALMGVASAGLAQAAQMERVTVFDSEGNMAVKASKAALKAGEVTFDVTNAANSTMQHEMIVAKLTSDEISNPDSLPYDDNTGKVDESKIKDLGEVSELDPGKTGTLTLDLKPGTYMLFCNMPGHYKSKMYTIIHVS